MSNFAEGYQREETNNKPKAGKRRCYIVNAEESVSRTSGLPMIVVTVTPSGSKAKIRYYIVKNERFNIQMTRFFDAFPTIGDGNFDFATWIGAEGAANFQYDDEGFLKIKWFVSPEEAANLPPMEEHVEQQTVSKIGETIDDDDMPF